MKHLIFSTEMNKFQIEAKIFNKSVTIRFSSFGKNKTKNFKKTKVILCEMNIDFQKLEAD